MGEIPPGVSSSRDYLSIFSALVDGNTSNIWVKYKRPCRKMETWLIITPTALLAFGEGIFSLFDSKG